MAALFFVFAALMIIDGGPAVANTDCIYKPMPEQCRFDPFIGDFGHGGE